MKHPLRTFEPNLEGRDFVIGDLHGSFNCLVNLLQNLKFDFKKDRMFSVGDLIDRGPDSMKCLELLTTTWFHPVLANHEQLMIESIDEPAYKYYWDINGGGWCIPQEHPLLMELVRQLPFMITVKLPDGGRVHIVHAELPPSSGATDEKLEDPEFIRKMATIETESGSFLTWGRFIFAHFMQQNLQHRDKVIRTFALKFKRGEAYFNDKLSHIISGHTILHHPLTLVGQTNIDTKAYGVNKGDRASWNALTCIELKTWTFYQATHDSFKVVEPVVVNTSDIDDLGKT